MGWMGRMTQWKDKAGENAEAASLGLLAYPALMAADILIYHATHVPVGEDQKQHLELTRDIAAKFNHDYGVDFFPMTEPVIEGVATRVMNLQDGTKKMSKSDPSDKTRINMTDDADTIAKKIRKAKTDPDPLPDSVAGLENRPDARNLVNIYAALAETTPQAVLDQHAGALFGHFKVALSDLAVEKLAPISSEMSRLMDDPAEIDRILHRGASARGKSPCRSSNGPTTSSACCAAEAQDFRTKIRTTAIIRTNNRTSPLRASAFRANGPKAISRRKETAMSHTDPQTRIGHVHLKVADLDRAIAFYPTSWASR
jgi:hypothetical protein